MNNKNVTKATLKVLVRMIDKEIAHLNEIKFVVIDLLQEIEARK